VEFVPFYLYGLPGDDVTTPADRNKYEFATRAFNDIFNLPSQETMIISEERDPAGASSLCGFECQIPQVQHKVQNRGSDSQ
jgi:hypothetical protein